MVPKEKSRSDQEQLGKIFNTAIISVLKTV